MSRKSWLWLDTAFSLAVYILLLGLYEVYGWGGIVGVSIFGTLFCWLAHAILEESDKEANRG